MKKISLILMTAISMASVSLIDAGFFSPTNPANQTIPTFTIKNNYGYPLYIKGITRRPTTEEVVSLNNGDSIPCGNLCLYQSHQIELLISTRTSPTYTDLQRFIDPYLSQMTGKRKVVITIQPSGIREDWKINVGTED